VARAVKPLSGLRADFFDQALDLVGRPLTAARRWNPALIQFCGNIPRRQAPAVLIRRLSAQCRSRVRLPAWNEPRGHLRNPRFDCEGFQACSFTPRAFAAAI